MKKVKIEFSEEEANALIGLLDIAVKTGGIQIAQSVVYMHEKVRNAFDPKVTEKVVTANGVKKELEKV